MIHMLREAEILRAAFQSQLHWHDESPDIRHVYVRPQSPRLIGNFERTHGIDEQEFYQFLDQDAISDDIRLFNEQLREWENH
jgi:hypothetical protein